MKMSGIDRKVNGKVVGFAVAVTFLMVASSFSVICTADNTRQGEELILNVAMQDDLKTLNPLGAGDVWTWNVVGYLYDGPINADPETEQLIPYIAVGSANLSSSVLTDADVDWSDCTVGTFGFSPRNQWADQTSNAIGETIIFYDFENVKWHDGVQLTARDILFSYHVQAQMPDWTSSVNCLKDNGGRAGSNFPNDHELFIEPVWWEGRETGVSKETGLTSSMKVAFKFTLQEAYADFFRNTLSAFLLPYHIWGTTAGDQVTDNTKIWLDTGYQVDGVDAWDPDKALAFQNPNPIGNGPFKFDHWDPAGGVSKIVTFRDHFYKPGFKYDNAEKPIAKQPTIDAILFKIYRTAEAAVLALKNKDVDFIAWSVPPSFVGELSNEPGVTLQQSPEQGFFYMSYNMRKQSFGYDESKSFPYAPDDDVGKPFRKAVAHCIDKQFIVQRLLLNFGIDATGPVSKQNEAWYNKSIPTYAYDPDEAINILTNAGYQLTNPSLPPGEGNWWLNPDGSPISKEADGVIKIFTPQADYDPIRALAGQMIADEMKKVGINAVSQAMDFGSIVDRIDQREFEMYILGWRIGSDPTDFLHAFFHSSTAAAGQNYPGYQNQTFDAIMDHARQTGDEDERKRDIYEAQAAIAYDLPYDVLYYRTNIEAYRSDRFTGWVVGSAGSIYNWQSIMNIRQPSPYKLNAQFVDQPSALESNQSVQVSVIVKDQDRVPVSGAQVRLNISMGALDREIDNTTGSGKITVTLRAPYVEPTADNIANGTQILFQIKEATYTATNGTEYDPAPSRIALITVYPEGAKFLSVKMSTESDVIDPDVNPDGTFGFTIVNVYVEDQDGSPAAGVTVYAEVSPAVPALSPASAIADTNGMATFTLTSTNLPDDDGSIEEFLIIAKAVSSDTTVQDGTQNLHLFIVDKIGAIENGGTPFPTFLAVTSLFCLCAVSYGIIRVRKKQE